VTFTVATVGGHVSVAGLSAALALETAASLVRAGAAVTVAEFTAGGSFRKAITFYPEEQA
jgi:hypothetical protein